MKMTSHRLAFTIALVAILAAVVMAMMSGTAPRDIQETRSTTERTRTRETSFNIILSGKTFTDPAAALHSISKLPESDRLPSEMRLAQTWGRYDFPAARDWAMSCGTSSRSDILTALGRGAMGSHPRDVMALAAELATGQARISFFTTMIQTWASTDPEAAQEWVEQCDLAEKPSIQTALVTEISQNDPRQAATYVAITMEPGSAQDQAALTVAARWAALDPAAANAWALSLPESDLQQRVLAAVTSISRP
jgi:hypothetical protein